MRDKKKQKTRKLLDISHRDHITNKEVKARTGNAIGPYKDILTPVKSHELKWYGHDTRSSGLAKTVLQGTVQGERRGGRGNDGKTTSKSGLALNGIPYYENPRTARSGGSWLKNLQWCPNAQPYYGIGEVEGQLISLAVRHSLNKHLFSYTHRGRCADREREICSIGRNKVEAFTVCLYRRLHAYLSILGATRGVKVSASAFLVCH